MLVHYLITIFLAIFLILLFIYYTVTYLPKKQSKLYTIPLWSYDMIAELDLKIMRVLQELDENYMYLRYTIHPSTNGLTYVVDKKHIYIKLTCGETDTPIDINTLMYITLHEIAHIITVTEKETHGTMFIHNYIKLINVATKLNFYDPTQTLSLSHCNVI